MRTGVRTLTRTRLPGARALRSAVLQVLVLGGVLGGVQAVLFLDSSEGPFGVIVLITITGWVYLAAGALAWVRRPSNRTGPLLCGGGIVWLLAALANTDSPPLVAVGLTTSTVPVAVVLHALLAFPSGRLRERTPRVLAGAGYVTTAVLQAPVWLLSDPTAAGSNPLLLAERPDVLAPLRSLQGLAAAVVVLGVAVLLVRRWWVAAASARRVLAPLYAYGVLAVVSVSSAANLARLVEIEPVDVFRLQIVLLAGVPVAFVAGVLLGGFARTAEVEELAAWLGTAQWRGSELGPMLARALGDPSLRLVLRSDDGGWVDAAGAEVEPPGDHVLVRLGDRTVGAIGYDTSLLPDPGVVDTAGRVVAIAVDRQRLTAQLLAEQEQLRISRTRLVEAGDRERRRLARDLHDRLQGRLVVLAMRLGTLAPDSPDEEVEQVRRDVADVISELRRLVQGMMPALLLERGLAAAVEEMLERVPLRTALDVDVDVDGVGGDAGRLPESVEGTAYHVVAEALTNALKHAGAQEVRVSLRRGSGVLTVDVRDDGVGGARAGAGTGLRGIDDRVDALGGRLRVHSPAGAGTRLVVELPCGSSSEATRCGS